MERIYSRKNDYKAIRDKYKARAEEIAIKEKRENASFDARVVGIGRNNASLDYSLPSTKRLKN